ncbi:Inositol hexakisphosphate and diphosphoinositol-pentakisphosphate kinase 2 [Ataeniobius toweri]|uniref:Inositol hexakisphosphate and diphosphoinositol-pentakisphosphate kinase 2 n=1 Tax=Ataeniobius toweri TaxID=208326 RepID=A0ABU7B2J8_9TELE|nr:Inositol hexakisphosphate and diphosphoinositol-pentakisphosphate kinase 2 [Ataeniobius toweri]
MSNGVCYIPRTDRQEWMMDRFSISAGLLALEGELTPILVQMVKSANMNGLLDSDSLTDCQQKVKARLHEIMQKDQQFTQDDYHKLAPTGSPSLVNSMKVIENPVQTCDKVYALIQSLTSQIRKRLEDPKSAGQ